MNPENFNTLYQYTSPFTGKCDECREKDITIFYETPNGEQLCNNCTKQIFESFRERGLGLEVVEELENNSTRNSLPGDADKSKTELQDIVTKVVPAQSRGRVNPTVVEFEYEEINWAAVDKTDTIEEDQFVAWDGGPGAYNEVSTTGFEAVRAYFDSSLSESNVVFLTGDGPYVYEFVVERVDKKALAGEVLRVVADQSRTGIINGLQPRVAIEPPIDRLYEHLGSHNNIEAFDITEKDEEFVCEVVLRQNRGLERVVEEVQTVDGIRYPKPDGVEIVENLE